jgi:DNA polymerase I-like protein with 3'-5' exonuclease and polymerase domains
MSTEWKPLTALPDLRNVGRITLDVETKDDGLIDNIGSGWPWGGGYVCGVSVAWRANGAIQSLYAPLAHPDTANVDRDALIRWLQDLVTSDLNIVGHNTLYDFGWLQTDLGVAMPPPERLEETAAAATLVDENQLSYKLDALCAWRGIAGKDEALLREGCATLGLIPKNSRKKFKPQEHIWRLPARFVGPYAEQDTISTLLLFESLKPALDREGTYAAYRVEVELLPMVAAMRRRGIRIDTVRAEQVRDLILARRDAVFKELAEKLGTSVSMAEIGGKKWLKQTHDTYGIECPLTDKGNPSFTASWMSKHPHWLPRLIDKADRYNKAGVHFLEGQILEHLQNGRVFGEIYPHRSDNGGTRSLRFSYGHPSLQQTPAHDEELAPLIRGVFLPEDGETWASCDLSQQEFRLLVHYAARHKLPGAAEARDRYINDPRTDFHLLVSEFVGGMLDRHRAKGTNFGKIYGAGVRKFAEMIGKPEAEAEKIYALYDEKLPFVSQLANRCQQAAMREGFLTLLDSARRHFNQWAPGGRWEEGAGPCSRAEADRRTHDPGHPWYGRPLYRADTRKALNALVQGSGARYVKLWMREVWRSGVTPMLQMHDSLDLSVASPEQAEMVTRLGEEVIKLEVPMRVDVKFGRTWADAKHTWAELHTENDGRERTQREGPILSSVSGEATNSAPTEDPLPWEGGASFENPQPHVSDTEQPAHICIHCHLQPPDGTERAIGADGAWIHPRCEDAYIDARLAEEGIALEQPREIPPPPPPPTHDEPPSGNEHGPTDGGNGAWRGDGSKTEAARDTYTEEHAGELFDDTFLRQQGYKLVQAFDYTLADHTSLYQQNRYELKKGYTPSKKRQRKRFLPHHKANGKDLLGAGARRVIYNWPAIMHAGPGSTVFVTEGENKAAALIKAGLLATTVLSHDWVPECVAALTERHVIILADHDKDGERLAGAAQKKLAPVAASTRIIPASHLWRHLPGDKTPAPRDDVVDWIKLGGDPKQLLDICRKIPADGIITAKPYLPPAEADIAPWQWLYGRLLLRSEVTGTAAMGGTGKSTLSIVEALAMASGRALLGQDVPQPLRVVLINLEDTRNTMDKRIAAAMRHYKLTATDIGDRLIVIGKGDIKIKVARQLRSGDVERNEQTIRALTRLVHKHRADVLSIDSFIRTHKVNENDNSAMQEVVECYEDIAVEGRCAVHLWHHTRKLGGEKATIEAARGASAFVDACRSARVLETMSAKDHEQLKQIQPDMLPPGFYFRGFSGKRSFAPPVDQSDWHRIESIILANGDNVGVVTAWRYPASQDAIAPEVIEHIIAEIDQGMPNGQRFSNHNSATKRQAWPIVQKHCSDKTQEQCHRIIVGWVKDGLLNEEPYDDPVYKREQIGLFAHKPEPEENKP